jgi:1-aminocyclopropane-1-carboxylate deaminase
MVPNDTRPYREGGNVQLTHIMGATHLPIDTPEDTALKTLEEDGKKPYWIPSGASLHPLGGLGYARCAFEIAQQEKEVFGEEGSFGVIVVPTASGSTLAGLVAGFKAVDQGAGLEKKGKRRLIGVLAAPKDKKEFIVLVLGIARTAAKLIGIEPESITESDFEIDDRWSAGQYGKLDDRTREGIKLLASVEGVITDPVYSGKALTGTLEMLRKGEVGSGQKVLFLHTGGMASVGAYEGLR